MDFTDLEFWIFIGLHFFLVFSFFLVLVIAVFSFFVFFFNFRLLPLVICLAVSAFCMFNVSHSSIFVSVRSYFYPIST